MNSQAAEGLTGLLEWSGPVIFDRLCMAYAKRIRNHDNARRLAKQHCRVWRALLEGDAGGFESERGILARDLGKAGLTLDDLADADNQTMNELVEIVIARFRRSPRTSQGYHLALLQLAMQLRPMQAA